MSDSDESEERERVRRPPPANPNEGLHPLFWDEIPDGAENDVHWQALEALKNESTLEERAENFKIQGNNKLKIGLQAEANKHVLREAIDFYSKGLELKCSDTKLNSILLSNRAHVDSLIGNWRKSLEDSLEAQKLDPDNIKAYFRCAKAALQLGRHEICQQQCQAGTARAVDGKTAQQFSTLSKEAEDRRAEQDRLERDLIAKRDAEAGPSRVLAEAILSRGVRVCRPQVRLESRSKPELDPDSGLLHWPVVFMYPESAQQDAIEAFCEEDTFSEHLDMMFGPDSPPIPWDVHRKYTRESIEVYYLTYAGRQLERETLVLAMQGKWPEGHHETGPQRYGEKAAKWQLVDENLTLIDLMKKQDYVVPGVPLLFIVAKGTEYRERFLSQINK